MSIILKGIDMPKDGKSICITIWSDGIVYARDVEEDETIDAEAEAIQIPTPHGRIIDESDLTDELTELNDLNLESLAPTILEAEE